MSYILKSNASLSKGRWYCTTRSQWFMFSYNRKKDDTDDYNGRFYMGSTSFFEHMVTITMINGMLSGKGENRFGKFILDGLWDNKKKMWYIKKEYIHYRLGDGSGSRFRSCPRPRFRPRRHWTEIARDHRAATYLRIAFDDKYVKLEQQLRDGKINPQQIIDSIEPEDHTRMAWFLWRVYIDNDCSTNVAKPQSTTPLSTSVISSGSDDFKEYDYPITVDDVTDETIILKQKISEYACDLIKRLKLNDNYESKLSFGNALMAGGYKRKIDNTSEWIPISQKKIDEMYQMMTEYIKTDTVCQFLTLNTDTFVFDKDGRLIEYSLALIPFELFNKMKKICIV